MRETILACGWGVRKSSLKFSGQIAPSQTRGRPKMTQDEETFVENVLIIKIYSKEPGATDF